MSQCGPFRLVYLGARIRTCCHAPNVATLVRLVYISLHFLRRPVKCPGRPQSSSRKHTLALPGPSLASGLRQSSSVAVHTIACSDVVSFEDESWDIPNV